MFQPSTSRDPLHTSGGDSVSDSGERVEEHAYDDDPNAGEAVYFTDVDEGHTLTPISEPTVVEGVDADVLKLPREDQRFIFVEFSPDWSLVVTVTSDGTFSVWAATNELVLVGLKRLPQDGRILKCIAFDPYNARAALLCFDSGEIFRTNLRRPATSDDPGSSQEQGMFRAKLVHKCEGRKESRFDYFTFSSDRRIMVYYNHDGELAAVQFHEQVGVETITLSKEFKLKQGPKIYVSEQSVLVTAVMKSSEDRESTSERIETLFWSELDFRYTTYYGKLVRLEGEGYLSNDGKYVVISSLVTKHQSTCCQLDLYLTKDVKSNMNMKCTPFTSRTLTFTSSYPYLEFLDWNQFNFLKIVHKQTEPFIAIHQTNSVGNRLLLWDTYSDAFVYEVDLTLNKEAREFSEVQYCWSSDYKWLGVCSIGARMMGLVCARSGIFVWTAHVLQISREDTRFYALKFDPSGTRLMIYLGKLIYLLEPPCLSKKPQKHPMRDNLLLSQNSRKYSDFEILKLAKEWPKQVLFNVLVAGLRAKPEYQLFLLDVAISLTSKMLAMVCKTYEGYCFLSILDYTETSSWESLWLVVLSSWNRCAFGKSSSHLVKEIRGSQRRKGISVFYYDNEETSNEHVTLISSEGGVEMLDMDSNLNEISEWTTLSNETCFSFIQSRDRRRVISLTEKHVTIIDLKEKRIVKSVEYSFGLSQWWEVLLDRVQFFAYSHYDNFIDHESSEEQKLFLQDRLRGLFDVSEDGETILIGWDHERNKSLVITSHMSEKQFRTEWDEAHESLYQCSMLTENGEWLGFIDYKKLIDGDIVVCVVNIESNRQQRVWLGSNEMLARTSSKPQPIITNFFLQVDEAREKLTILGLEEIGPQNKLKQFFVELVYDVECLQDHQSLLEAMTEPTNMDKYGESNQPFIFNMNVATINNFQRVLAEEGEHKMEEMAKCAIRSKVKVSNVHLFCPNDEHRDMTFLSHAHERRETSLVQLCLRFIEDGLFTFHSASDMVKDSFFEMLFSYNELLLPILKKNSLTFKAAEIMVPAGVFQSQNSISNGVFTSNTLLEPNEHFVETAIEDLKNSKNNRHFGFTKHLGEERKVLSYVYFHNITNACKIGLNGIVRKLLMLEVDSSIFKTELIRTTITWKWDKLWKRKCLQHLYVYIIFLVFFTSYAMSIGVWGDSVIRDKKVGLGISFSLLGAFVSRFVLFISECRQLKTYIKDGKEVFGNHWWGLRHYFFDSQWNTVEVASYTLVLVLIPYSHGLYIFECDSTELLFELVAIELILAWVRLWYYAQMFERTGVMVLLISNAVHDGFPVLLLALFILVGFSLALYVLFQCASKVPSTNALEEEEEELIRESFGRPWRSLSTLFYAMLGTLDPKVYNTHQSFSQLTTLIFIFYMAVEMIVVLNMCIAVMGDAYDRVKKEEDLQMLIGRARFIDAYEASLSARQIREVENQIGRFLYVLTPKDAERVTKKTTWKGRINAIEVSVNKTVDLLEANIMKAIEENKKVIQENKEEMENKIHRLFHQMESVTRKTLEGHERHQEEHWKKEQDLLLSISKRIEALEVETNRLASNVGHQTT